MSKNKVNVREFKFYSNEYGQTLNARVVTYTNYCKVFIFDSENNVIIDFKYRNEDDLIKYFFRARSINEMLSDKIEAALEELL